MARYIELDALVAEIKSRIKSLEECFNGKFPMSQSVKETEQDKGKLVAYKSILSFSDSLEVKKVNVDFEQELYKAFGQVKDFTLGMRIAKHFFELGIKARIDKELVEEVYSHIDSIKDTADRMTSGNFMHNRAAIKFSANTIAKVLELMGLKRRKENNYGNN